MITTTRKAAVAGRFYPAEPAELSATVDALLGAAPPDARANLRGLIAPHAGFVYSGPVAATAYALIAGRQISTVVLVGPSHTVAFEGVAVPSVSAFETPLGRIALDGAVLRQLLKMPTVIEADEPHAREHSLEVHLPFLQRTLKPGFLLVPLVVGDAPPHKIADILEVALDGADRLLVVSTDLSHFLGYDAARMRDAKTSEAIAARRGDALGAGDACGRLPVQGALELARRRGDSIETLDLRSSGDTAGDRARVVGYGSWAILGAPA